MTSFFSPEGGAIWIKFWRLVQNDMSTAVMWSKSKPDVEFQYGGRFGKFNGMSSQSHLPHCRVLPLGEFNVMIPESHATLQGVRISSAILKIVFRHILFFVLFLMQFRLWLATAFVSSPIHLLYMYISTDYVEWPVRFQNQCTEPKTKYMLCILHNELKWWTSEKK